MAKQIRKLIQTIHETTRKDSKQKSSWYYLVWFRGSDPLFKPSLNDLCRNQKNSVF